MKIFKTAIKKKIIWETAEVNIKLGDIVCGISFSQMQWDESSTTFAQMHKCMRVQLPIPTPTHLNTIS